MGITEMDNLSCSLWSDSTPYPFTHICAPPPARPAVSDRFPFKAMTALLFDNRVIMLTLSWTWMPCSSEIGEEHGGRHVESF